MSQISYSFAVSRYMSASGSVSALRRVKRPQRSLTGADEILWRFGGLIGWDEVFAPGLVKNTVVAGGAESENSFGSGRLPVAHARLLAAAFYQRLAQTLGAPAA
ncbi:MAG: hypothetical protein U9N87_07925, partial [Planctomycetota bacterium]|nr:hypothetical protein [Planctomycetota bacterium]